MIIDAYSHGIHGRYLDRLIDTGGDWFRQNMILQRERMKQYPYFFDMAPRIEQLNKYGIDLQVVAADLRTDANLLPGDVKTKLAFAKAVNDNLARLMEDSKGRLPGVGTMPITSVESGGRQEVERAIKTLGLKGIILPSNVDGKPLDLPEFEPFWAQAAEMDFAVYIHPTDPVSHAGRTYEAEYQLNHYFGWPYESTLALSRLVFSGLMGRYPNLKIVGHHLGGGMIPFFLGRIIQASEAFKQEGLIGKALPEPLSNYFSRFYYDTAIGENAAAIKLVYEVFGADQIVFGTDFPYGPKGGEPRLATYPEVVRSLGFSEADNKKIFEDNARKILNLA